MLIVFTTVPTAEEASSLADKIVDARLGACVQILPQMMSVYIWQGAIQHESEHLLLIKTLPEKWDDLRDFISTNHSYSVPEIVAIDAMNVTEPYERWLAAILST
jgi:periplasmic divalent cation tolerance protein